LSAANATGLGAVGEEAAEVATHGVDDVMIGIEVGWAVVVDLARRHRLVTETTETRETRGTGSVVRAVP